MFVFLAAVLFWWSVYPGRLGAIYAVQCKVYDSQIATLKEIKQVQLQILELQASLLGMGEPPALPGWQ